MTLHALIFDVDGTLAETEELHRQAFNRTFARFDLDWDWDAELYAELLGTAGGKERLACYIEQRQPSRRDLLEKLGELHKAKSATYLELLADGALALRPGVARLIGEARATGLRLAIATTTTPENVVALLAGTLGPESPDWFVIAAGDMVDRKKPDPAVYELALRRLAVEPAEALAFEDSVNGIAAAKAAGLRVVATPSLFLAHEDLSAADAVVSDLGEPDKPGHAIAGHRFAKGYVDLEGLNALVA